MNWSDLSPALFTLAAGGAFFVGFAKSGIPGFGLLFVAIFAAVFDAKASTGLVLPLLIFGDLVAIRNYRAHTQWKVIRALLPWTLAGVVAGWWALGRIESNRTMQVLIGGILISMIALHFLRQWLQAHEAATQAAPPGKVRTAVVNTSAGLTVGFATMTANAAGPVTTLYFIARRLPKFEFLGTAAWFYCIVNIVKIPFSTQLGLINAESLGLNLALAPFVLMGSVAGMFAVRRINQRTFEITALVLTTVAALNLLFNVTGRLSGL
jgi:uncharacterized membrane protein YfcA